MTLTVEIDGARYVLEARVADLVREIVSHRQLIAALPRGNVEIRWEGDQVHPCWINIQPQSLGSRGLI